jgi:hypothetical protein
MAYKKMYAKIGTHSGDYVYFYHGQDLKIANIVFASLQSDFENSKPFQRKLPLGSFGNRVFKRYVIDNINSRIIFLSLA